MESFNHTDTMVLLIGTSHFPSDPTIEPIPNVAANLQALKSCLQDTSIIGVPEANITISLNEDRNTIEKKLRDIAEKTKNKKYTLLVYYSGHGIMSSQDYHLYMATHNTTRNDLEIDGLSLESFKKYIKRSAAGRKIVLLDCCHSGTLINSMADADSAVRAVFKAFDGTYILTSAAHNSPSLFAPGKPHLPTLFTGKFIQIANEGIANEHEYVTLRDIFNQLDADFTARQLPRPQQFNFNRTDELGLFRNKQFVRKRTPEEIEWEKAVAANTIWSFVEFRRAFPAGKFAPKAKELIYQLEDQELWSRTNRLNTVFAYDEYLEKFPSGKFAPEAAERLNQLKTTYAAAPRWNIIADFLKRPLVGPAIIAITIIVSAIFLKLSNNNPYAGDVNVQGLGLSDADSLFRQNKRKEALKIYQQNIEWLNERQQFNLAEIYEDSIPKKAFYWNRRSADLGYTPAMVKVGDAYRNGINEVCEVKKDSAFFWYTLAANRGNATAMRCLSQMYRTGEGITKDVDKANSWSMQSNQAGSR